MRKQILGFFVATIVLTFYSCAFPKEYTNNSALTKSNLAKLNGVYKVKPEMYGASDDAYQRFYRGREGRDTVGIDDSAIDQYSFGLNVVNDKIIEIQYLKDNKVFGQKRFGYKLKKGGYLLIKNKNFQIVYFPYIFGGIDVKKRRLSLDSNFLVIDEVHHSSGAMLLIFGDSKTWTSRDRYERIR